ncbi:MAG: hypothetical protein K0S20_497 [Patescibacteria group bacterium]|jgi:hypothetical protein|nr:hypothetical protein [Patescibacteria group bacterium]
MDGSFLPIFIVLAIFGILAGFFRKLFGKVVVVLAIQIALFVFFPELLIKFAQLIAVIRDAVNK